MKAYVLVGSFRYMNRKICKITDNPRGGGIGEILNPLHDSNKYIILRIIP